MLLNWSLKHMSAQPAPAPTSSSTTVMSATFLVARMFDPLVPPQWLSINIAPHPTPRAERLSTTRCLPRSRCRCAEGCHDLRARHDPVQPDPVVAPPHDRVRPDADDAAVGEPEDAARAIDRAH